MNALELGKKANEVRKTVIDIVAKAKSSHIGGSLSVVDIITALYFRIMRIDSRNLKGPNNDVFILSKGHCCSALYSVLAHRKIIDIRELDNYCMDGSKIWGHLTLGSLKGVDATTGSLGHGLPIGAGMAYAAKHDKTPPRVFVVISDGECDEGSVWEAALFASHHKLDNLIVIVDYNKIQSFGTVKEVLNLEPLAEKWKSFGWSVKEIDGHDMNKIIKVLENVPFKPSKPTLIIAHTIKGKGISFMENRLEWHYKSLNDELYSIARNELNSNGEKYEKLIRENDTGTGTPG